MHTPPPYPPKNAPRRRTIWWVQIIRFAVLAVAVAGCYLLAGGDGSDLYRPIIDQFAQPSRPLLIALIVLLSVTVVADLTAWSTRRAERRAANEWQPVPAGGSRALVEKVVRLCGPITFDQIHDRLLAGGPWGAPLPISKTALRRLLKKPGRDSIEPAEWLAPRVAGELYDHTDNLKARENA
jgi:hypothetical protein